MGELIRNLSEITCFIFRHLDRIVPFLVGGFMGLWIRGHLIASTSAPVPNALICFVLGGIAGLAFWRQIFIDNFTDRNRE